MSQAPLESPAGEQFVMPWRFYRRRYFLSIELMLAVGLAMTVEAEPIARLLIMNFVLLVAFDDVSPTRKCWAELISLKLVVVDNIAVHIVRGASAIVVPFDQIEEVEVKRVFFLPDLLRLKTEKGVYLLPILGESGARLVHLVKAATPVSAHTQRAKHWVYTPRRGPLIAPSAEPWNELANVLAKEQG